MTILLCDFTVCFVFFTIAEEKKPLKGAEKNIIENKYLTVQKLSEEPIGTKQRYQRVGPHVFVPFNYDTISIENIKYACQEHVEHDDDTYCDILASEQGPSCSMVCQIPKLSLIHVRFTGDKPSEFIESKYLRQPAFGKQEKRKMDVVKSSFPSSTVSKFPSKFPSFKKTRLMSAPTPVSLTVTKMMQLGKLISDRVTKIKIEYFDIALFCWKEFPEVIQCKIEKEKFAEGAFRFCYKAESTSPQFTGKIWVIKRFKPEAIEYFKENTNQGKDGYSEEEQAKKTVQMHTLAKHFTDSLKKKATSQFGRCFKYENLYYGCYEELEEKIHITLEEFQDGKFVKYINNTGEIIHSEIAEEYDERIQKAEALAHFSYVSTNRKAMLLDIQGTDYCLIDPEIATEEINQNEGESEFTAGNMAVEAIATFTSQHKCNKFCKYLELKEL